MDADEKTIKEAKMIIKEFLCHTWDNRKGVQLVVTPECFVYRYGNGYERLFKWQEQNGGVMLSGEGTTFSVEVKIEPVDFGHQELLELRYDNKYEEIYYRNVEKKISVQDILQGKNLLQGYLDELNQLTDYDQKELEVARKVISNLMCGKHPKESLTTFILDGTWKLGDIIMSINGNDVNYNGIDYKAKFDSNKLKFVNSESIIVNASFKVDGDSLMLMHVGGFNQVWTRCCNMVDLHGWWDGGVFCFKNYLVNNGKVYKVNPDSSFFNLKSLDGKESAIARIMDGKLQLEQEGSIKRFKQGHKTFKCCGLWKDGMNTIAITPTHLYKQIGSYPGMSITKVMVTGDNSIKIDGKDVEIKHINNKVMCFVYPNDDVEIFKR